MAPTGLAAFAGKKPKAEKGAVTDLNKYSLFEHMGGEHKATNRVDPTSSPGIRRAMKGGLVEVKGQELHLTDSGKKEQAAWEAKHSANRVSRHENEIGMWQNIHKIAKEQGRDMDATKATLNIEKHQKLLEGAKARHEKFSGAKGEIQSVDKAGVDEMAAIKAENEKPLPPGEKKPAGEWKGPQSDIAKAKERYAAKDTEQAAEKEKNQAASKAKLEGQQKLHDTLLEKGVTVQGQHHMPTSVKFHPNGTGSSWPKGAPQVELKGMKDSQGVARSPGASLLVPHADVEKAVAEQHGGGAGGPPKVSTEEKKADPKLNKLMQAHDDAYMRAKYGGSEAEKKQGEADLAEHKAKISAHVQAAHKEEAGGGKPAFDAKADAAAYAKENPAKGYKDTGSTAGAVKDAEAYEAKHPQKFTPGSKESIDAFDKQHPGAPKPSTAGATKYGFKPPSDFEDKLKAHAAAGSPKPASAEAPGPVAPKPAQSVQTGAKGGRFYVNANGTKVYVK